METTIALPDDLVCLRAGEVVPVSESLASTPKLIVFIDSTECTNCRISHFYDYSELFELSEKTGKFEVVLLLSSRKEKYQDTFHYVKGNRFPFPVYLDLENSYLAINKVIPADIRYHAVTVDGQGHVLFVGDPIRGNMLMKLFKQTFDL